MNGMLPPPVVSSPPTSTFDDPQQPHQRPKKKQKQFHGGALGVASTDNFMRDGRVDPFIAERMNQSGVNDSVHNFGGATVSLGNPSANANSSLKDRALLNQARQFDQYSNVNNNNETHESATTTTTTTSKKNTQQTHKSNKEKEKEQMQLLNQPALRNDQLVSLGAAKQEPQTLLTKPILKQTNELKNKPLAGSSLVQKEYFIWVKTKERKK